MPTFRAPGRVNLCGEHTDYNHGYVLPAALDMDCRVSVEAGDGHELHLISEAIGRVAVPIRELGAAEPRGDWTDYPIGVAKQLVARRIELAPVTLTFRSTVPVGAGLSSSAALEVSTALALLSATGAALDRVEIAKVCLAAEREFVGMQCGIMDQFASLFGAEDHALFLDCRSLEHRLVRLPQGLAIVVVNSGVKHELAGSAYNDRVRECAEACAQLGLDSLRELDLSAWQEAERKLSEIPRRRAKHIVHENQRVLDFASACDVGDVATLTRVMAEGHRSVSNDYEISCEELDFLVEAAVAIDGVVGSRMTGGGFGGCTVNLVYENAVAEFRSRIRGVYAERYDREADVYECRPAAGAGPVVEDSSLE